MIENLTVVIPYRDEAAALLRLRASIPDGIPIIVVDDASATLPAIQSDARYIRRTERGYFSGAVNTGIDACQTDVLVLNQDITLQGDAWQGIIDQHRSEYAMIGDGVFDHPGHPAGYVQGTFMFLRRDAIGAVGGLNERDWPLWGATAEWQLRACRRGFRSMPLRSVPGMAHERIAGRRFGKSISKLMDDQPQDWNLMIRTPPLISVIIPSFNYAHLLPDAINSLIGGRTCLGAHPGQTFAGFEAIVVDDASTDNTPAVMAKLADPWKGVRYLRMAANVGCPACENAGIKAAYGRYIAILSADDMYEPEMLERIYRVIEQNPDALVYTDQRVVTAGKRAAIWPMRDYDFNALIERNHVPPGVMFAKAAWERVGGYPEAMRWGREDWAFAVAMGRAGYCGVRIPEPLYLYRRDGQNRTLRNAGGEWRKQFVQQMHDLFPDIYGGNRPMGCCGGGSRQGAARHLPMTTKQAAAMRTGERGMTLVEYIGGNVGRTMWYGEVTGTRYTFSATRRVGYVDNRDLAVLLDTMYDRARAFRLYTPPAPAVVIVQPLPEMVEAVEDHVQAYVPEPAAKPKRAARKVTRKAVAVRA